MASLPERDQWNFGVLPFYKIEQRNPVTLFDEQAMCDENDDLSTDDEDEFDHIIHQSQDSDTEQELSDYDEQGVISSHDQFYYTARDKVTIWSSQPTVTDSSTTSTKIKLKIRPALNATTEMECWNQFITKDMLKQILNHTNFEIKQRQLGNKNPSRAFLMKETTMEELLALLGLLYLAGLNHSNRQNLSDLWRNDGTGVDIFRTTMSLQRFFFLQRCLRYDDAATRQERRKVDNISQIRLIFEQFVSKCMNNYIPGKYLTLGEKLEAFRGKCSFRQHSPNKTSKYGIKLYALVDSENFYTVNLHIDSGKQPNGPFSKSNATMDVVDKLVQPVTQSNRNITFDNRFMSVSLLKHLQDNHNLTSIGTIRKNNKEIPPNFVTTRGREVYSSMYAFQENMTLVSYVPKKSKVVLLLSSLHHNQRTNPDSDNKQKPEIVTFYDSTKKGVDVVDELCSKYDVSRNSSRWPTMVFYAVMNIAAINSFIVYRENVKSQANRKDFIRKLGLTMLEGHLSLRKNVETLPRELRKRIHERTGETLGYSLPKNLKAYKRCKDCPSAKDRKTKNICNNCNKPICGEHIVPVCQTCIHLYAD